MNPDSYSIAYLMGAGMVSDLLEWAGVLVFMLGSSFALGIGLGAARKRRIARIAANYEHFVPTVPACGVAQSCNGCSTCPDLERK